MPVYPQTYRHYDGTYRPRTISWSVIASKGIWRAWKSWGTYWVLMLGVVIFLSFFARIHLAANAELIEWFGLNASFINEYLSIGETFYYDYLRAQSFILFLFTIIFGADMIALDRRTKAITLYLSKPINRFDYVFGKASILLAFLFLITVGGSFLLMLAVAILNDDAMYVVREFPLMLRIFAYSGLLVVPPCLIILAMSSMAKTRIAATVFFCLLYWLPNMLILLFRDLTRRMWVGLDSTDWWSAFSLQNIWTQLGNALFNQPPEFNLHWGAHLFVLVLLCLLSIGVLYRQIRAVEVVK